MEPKQWGLWSFARNGWMQDYDPGPPEVFTPYLFETFMDAAKRATDWHFSFQLFPREYPDGPLPEDC